MPGYFWFNGGGDHEHAFYSLGACHPFRKSFCRNFNKGFCTGFEKVVQGCDSFLQLAFFLASEQSIPFLLAQPFAQVFPPPATGDALKSCITSALTQLNMIITQ